MCAEQRSEVSLLTVLQCPSQDIRGSMEPIVAVHSTRAMMLTDRSNQCDARCTIDCPWAGIAAADPSDIRSTRWNVDRNRRVRAFRMFSMELMYVYAASGGHDSW